MGTVLGVLGYMSRVIQQDHPQPQKSSGSLLQDAFSHPTHCHGSSSAILCGHLFPLTLLGKTEPREAQALLPICELKSRAQAHATSPTCWPSNSCLYQSATGFVGNPLQHMFTRGEAGPGQGQPSVGWV